LSVGEQLLWLSIDGFDSGSVAGLLDPTRLNFIVAWREFHGRGKSALTAALMIDDVGELRSQLFATDEPNFNQDLRVVSAGGDVFELPSRGNRHLSILAVASQFGAVRCARFLLANAVRAEASEVGAAFRNGNAELVRLLWDSCPHANPLELALEAVKSWNAAGFRWLLEHTLPALSYGFLVRLLRGACLFGSYSCVSSVLGVSGSAAAHSRGLGPVGIVGRVLCGGLAALKSVREFSFVPEHSIAAGYGEALREWLPEAMELTLVARHEGRDAASVNAFIDAAKGRARTLTFVETENGGSISGCYLDVA
jgi:hypothetical protein